MNKSIEKYRKRILKEFHYEWAYLSEEDRKKELKTNTFDQMIAKGYFYNDKNNMFYKKVPVELSESDINSLLPLILIDVTNQMNEIQNIIKNIMISFLVMAIISIIFGVVAYFNIQSAFQSIYR
jgi:hypothetical protein